MVILRELNESLFFDSGNSTHNIHQKRAVLAMRLNELTKRNGYQIIQSNGQRIYASPSSQRLPSPPKGCEVFIGRLQKDLYEDELIPLFEKIGPLYNFRLMLDFREQTRGYAFATYFSKSHADQAVYRLDGYEIRRGVRLGVYKSVDNRRLFIGNVPPLITKLDVKELLNEYVDGVVDIIMYNDYVHPKLNRGFVFVEFENHRLAAMARRQLAPDNLIAWGQVLHIDWADPVPEVHPKIMAKVSILYLKNLPIGYTSDDMHKLICEVIDSRVVKKTHKIANYAFVHFIDRRSAEIAFSKLGGFPVIDEHGYRRIQVEWARPRRFSKRFRLSSPPANFCTSVPPCIRKLVYQRLAEKNTSSSSTSSFQLVSPQNTLTYNFFASQISGSSSPMHY